MKNSSLVLRLVFLLLCFGASTASAHKPSDSYLRIDSSGPVLTAEWDIALKDLELLVGIDSNGDGKITWGELKANEKVVAAHVLPRLTLTADGKAYSLEETGLLVSRHSDGAYATLLLETDCPSDTSGITLGYDLLFAQDPTHRGLVLFDTGEGMVTRVLSPEVRSVEVPTETGGWWTVLKTYIIEGVWHIWIGLDHILFLLCLLFPAVLLRENKEWKPVERARPAASHVLKIVTLFTVAHSITLWLAVMEYVTLPSRAIESVIAFSIVVTAVHNLYPVLRLPGWAIAFFFGLVHGFGFANVLLDLGLAGGALALSLFGFNVGVELGQLAIVLVFFPLAFWLRRTKFYEVGILKIGSLIIAIIALIWMAERIFNLEIIGI